MPQKGPARLNRVVLITAVVVPIVAAILAAVATVIAAVLSYRVGALTANVAQLKNQFDEANALAVTSHGAIPNMVGKDKKLASLEISNLYFLAQDNDVAKRQVIKLVAFAKDPVLNESLVQILDADGRRIANESDIRILFGEDRPVKSKAGSGTDVAPDQSAQTKLLRAATTATTSGWSYLGRGSTGSGASGSLSTLDRDRTVTGERLPRSGDLVTFDRRVYLRVGPPEDANRFAPAAGVLLKGDTAVVKSVLSIPYQDGQRAVWAQIELLAHGHGETDTPVPVGPERVKFYITRDEHSTDIHVRNVGTQSVSVLLFPTCAAPASCRPSGPFTVAPVQDEHDAGNDHIYTVQTLDPRLAFDWNVAL